MKKGLVKCLVLLITVGIIGLGAIYTVYSKNISPVDINDNNQITVNIPKGSSAYSIIEILNEKGLIKNPTIAKIFFKINKFNNLQANTYILNKSMDLKEIFRIINTGDFKFISKDKLTIIEGSTIPQAAEQVANVLKINKEEVIRLWSDREFLTKLSEEYWFIDKEQILKEGIMFPLEGYLYPETYYLTDEKNDVENVTRLLLNKMGEVLTPLKNQIANMDFTIHEFLSLASIVQGESLFDKDRPIISGVFMNRLRKANMPLQSDITVLYALQEKRVNVTNNDLAVDSPYNTYKYQGLPIGPVCLMNMGTMNDLINYEKNDYLYFFATKEGKVLYSSTFQEHSKIVNENLWY